MTTLGSGVVFRPDLGQAYMELDLAMARAGYVGLRVMPRMTVPDATGRYPVLAKEALKTAVALNDLRRGPGGTFKRRTREVTSADYGTEEFGLEEPIDERVSKQLARVGVSAEQLATDIAVADSMEAIERGVAAIVQDATTYASQASNVGNQWDDYPNATPINDVKDAANTFAGRNGFRPNMLVLNANQAQDALLTEQVQAALKRPSEGLKGENLLGVSEDVNLMERVLAAVFGIRRVVIADGWRNTNSAGISASFSRIWSDEYVSLLYVSEGDLRSAPSFGRCVGWVEEGGGDLVIEEYDEPKTRSRIVRARFDLELLVVHSALLQILGNIS